MSALVHAECAAGSEAWARTGGHSTDISQMPARTNAKQFQVFLRTNPLLLNSIIYWGKMCIAPIDCMKVIAAVAAGVLCDDQSPTGEEILRSRLRAEYEAKIDALKADYTSQLERALALPSAR